MAANLDKLKDLLASLDPEETRQMLASARPQEQWTGRSFSARPATRSRVATTSQADDSTSRTISG